MVAKVHNFCQRYPWCQRTSPDKLALAPLIPLPIIGIPLKQVGMDLVGPLPKSNQGHKYILVIVNYATQYLEAISLCKATSTNITRELILLFSQFQSPRTYSQTRAFPSSPN